MQEVGKGDEEVEIAFGFHPWIEFSFVDEGCADGEGAIGWQAQNFFADFVHHGEVDGFAAFDLHDIERMLGAEKEINLAPLFADRRTLTIGRSSQHRRVV